MNKMEIAMLIMLVAGIVGTMALMMTKTPPQAEWFMELINRNLK